MYGQGISGRFAEGHIGNLLQEAALVGIACHSPFHLSSFHTDYHSETFARQGSSG